MLLLLLPLSAKVVLAAATSPLTFGVVPQQSASKLARDWGPLLQQIARDSGVAIRFKTAPDIPTFEKRLARGEYDIAYMNPYHYTVFSQRPGYRVLARARDKRITGILVVRRDSDIHTLDDLSGKSLAFPSASAFAASILTRSILEQKGITITPEYVSSHDSVYRTVAKGIYPAGGGVMRTMMALDTDVRSQLRILWSTEEYSPHAVAVHPRVSQESAKRILHALISIDHSDKGKALLMPLKIKGWQDAEDAEWDDVRALDIRLLDHLLRE